MPSNPASMQAPASTDERVDVSTTGKHVPALDGIRGLAILLVFAIHFLWSGNEIPSNNPVLWLGEQVKSIGWVGVDLFFALSGFLITGILYDTLKDPHFFRNFYARRTLRIFPLYYGFILLVTALLFVFHGSWNRWELIKLLTYTRNLSFPAPPPGPTTTLPWIAFNHFWSLCIEEQFYLVWPLCVFLLRTRAKISLAALAGILVSLTIRIVLSKTSIPEFNPYILYSWTPSHLDGLLMGALLAMGMRSKWEQRLLAWSRPVLLVGLALLCVMDWKCTHLLFELYWAVSIWGIPLLSVTFAALIAASLRKGSWLGRFFSTGFMRFFGKYSYGLYIYHYTLANLTSGFRLSVRAQFHSRLLSVLLPAALGVALSVVMSVLSYHFFEKRFLVLKRYFEAHSHEPKLDNYVAEGASQTLV